MTKKQMLGWCMVSVPFIALIGLYVHSLGFWKAMAMVGVVSAAILFILVGLMLGTGEFDD